MCGSILKANFTVAKWTYFTAFVLTAIVVWLLRDYGRYVAGYVGPLALCKSSLVASTASCIGKSAVLRIGWGNCMFFGLHFLLLIGVHTRHNPRRHVHTFCLPIQLLLWAAILAVSFTLPNHAIYVWGQVSHFIQCQNGSSILLLMPCMCTVHFKFSYGRQSQGTCRKL